MLPQSAGIVDLGCMFDYLLGNALLRKLFGAAYDTAAFRRRMGLVCFVLLSLMATAAGYFIGNRVRGEIVQLAAEGVTAQGRIVDKADGWNRNSAYYEFVVEYTSPDLARHRATISTDPTEYNSKRVGNAVSVRYLRSKPDRFYMVGREPQEAEVNVLRYFFYGGLASLAVSLLSLVIFWSGGNAGDTTPVPAMPSARLNSPQMTADPAPKRRQGFGQRG
jgi:hypothetical protein